MEVQQLEVVGDAADDVPVRRAHGSVELGERDLVVLAEARAEDDEVEVARPARPLLERAADHVHVGDVEMELAVDSLTGMQELWPSEERVRAFYTHTCPRLFDTRAIAAWVLQRGVHSAEFRSGIGHVAQVVLELDPAGRALAHAAKAQRYVDDGSIVAPTGDPATPAEN